MSLGVSGVGRRQRRRVSILDRRYTNPGKGIDVYASDQFINDLEASSTMNATLVELGGISKANNWDAVGSGLDSPPRGMGAYYPTGLDPMLLTIDDDTLKYKAGTIWTALSGATFTPSDKVCFIQAGGKMFIWNAKNAGAQLNGMVLTRPATTVTAGFGIYYADRQIVSGVREHPNRLYISSPTDVGDFTNANPTGTGPYSVYDTNSHPGATAFAGSDANYIDVALDDGDHITALAKYNTFLIIFKERAIYSMSFDGSGNPTIQLVTDALGAVAHSTVARSDNDLLFLSRKGYYVFGQQPNFQDQLRTNELSLRIKPFVQSITPANLDRVTSIWHNDIYLSAAPLGNSDTNNRVFTYHRQYTAWMQRDDMQPNAFVEFIDSDNVLKLYYADENTATVWVEGNGYTQSMHWESKAFDFSLFDVEKRYIDLTLLFRQLAGSVKVTVTIDGTPLPKSFTIPGTSFAGGLGRGLLGTSLLGGRDESGTSAANTITTNVPIRLSIGVQGRTIKFRVENDNIGQNFVLMGFGFGFRPYGRSTFDSSLRIYA